MKPVPSTQKGVYTCDVRNYTSGNWTGSHWAYGGGGRFVLRITLTHEVVVPAVVGFDNAFNIPDTI